MAKKKSRKKATSLRIKEMEQILSENYTRDEHGRDYEPIKEEIEDLYYSRLGRADERGLRAMEKELQEYEDYLMDQEGVPPLPPKERKPRLKIPPVIKEPTPPKLPPKHVLEGLPMGSPRPKRGLPPVIKGPGGLPLEHGIPDVIPHLPESVTNPDLPPPMPRRIKPPKLPKDYNFLPELYETLKKSKKALIPLSILGALTSPDASSAVLGEVVPGGVEGANEGEDIEVDRMIKEAISRRRHADMLKSLPPQNPSPEMY